MKYYLIKEIKAMQNKRLAEVRAHNKTYMQKEKASQKIRNIVTKAGWTNFEYKGLENFCKKVCRGSERKTEFGKEFTMRIIQLHTTPWIEIYTNIKDEKVVRYFGRCKKRKNLKRIEKLLNIK